MADRWYYRHDGNTTGPCTARQLRDLAARGGILPTDNVWKEGMGTAVAARKVKNLFPPAGAPAPERLPPAPAPAAPPPGAPQAPAEFRTGAAPQGPPAGGDLGDLTSVALVPEAGAEPREEAPPAHKPPGPQQGDVKKGRVVAARGAVIVAQDGANVKFRKKCVTCGHLDSSWHTMPIKNGVTRAAFFCPKCHKSRGVEIQGSLS